MITKGSRVRYNEKIKPDFYVSEYISFYPPNGTLGTVLDFAGHPDHVAVFVKWDSGTSDDGCWWCNYANIEEVDISKPETTNSVEKAYETLERVFNSKECTKEEAMIAIEEAVGYLGEALAE